MSLSNSVSYDTHDRTCYTVLVTISNDTPMSLSNSVSYDAHDRTCYTTYTMTVTISVI